MNKVARPAVLILILVLAAFLRFYRLQENLVFHGELGDNYLAIKNFIAAGTIPLLGPPTSHPWLFFGPLFYWIFAPFLVLGHYNPLTGGYFFAAAGVLVVVFNYFVVEKLFSKNIALISSFLIAISPLWIRFSRTARFFSLVTLFFYPFFYFLLKSLKEDSKYLFWTGFFLGVMVNFHLTPVILVPAVLALIILKREKIKKLDIYKGIVGFLIPNIAFLLHNALNELDMLAKFIVWIPYRIAGFIGLYPKNTVSASVLKSNLFSLNKFVILSFTPNVGKFGLILLVAILFLVGFKIRSLITLVRKEAGRLALLLIFFFGYLGIFIHGDPPDHYYLPLLPIPILFFSFLLDKMGSKYGVRYVVIILAFLSFINLRFYFSKDWYFKPEYRIVSILVPYSLQLKVSETIVNDAKGEAYSLSRVGPFDQFEGDYAQNYQYLMWWMGNEPVKSGSLKYTIYEETNSLPQDADNEIFWVGEMAILKEENEI